MNTWPPPRITDNPLGVVQGEERLLNGHRPSRYTVVSVAPEADRELRWQAWRTMPNVGGTGSEPIGHIAADPLVSRPGLRPAEVTL